ncbi:MAG: CotH kinase family protein [Brumimicrobium sp.]|nr:CotH kinase family protein [Brumimicrobium sp.]
MKLLIGIILTSIVYAPLFAQVVINEVSCSNRGNATDSFGENEDWVEFLNTGGTQIDLTGFYLSDNPNKLAKWQIPSGAVLNAGQRMMVYFSGRNIMVGSELHPSFKLSQTEGDVVILSGPGGNIGDSVHLANKITKNNHSFGRTTDGAATWSLFPTPTPNAANSGGTSFYMQRPSFVQQAGFYSGPQNIEINVPAGGQVRYTLDGSVPTAASTLYAGPINITGTTVIRAVTFGSQEESLPVTSTYFIDESHSVPVVSISGTGVYDLIANGNGGSFEPTGNFEIFEDDASFIETALGSFNKHGNDSWAYDQRGFDFIVRDEFGDNHKIDHQIFPNKARTQFKRLIFKAGANDNYPFENGAHIRDPFAQTLSQRAGLLLDERTWRPCVLYLNGVYWGVYEIREKYDDHNFTEEYYNQSEIYGQNQKGLHFLKTWGGTWEEYGAPDALTEWNALLTFIQNNNMGDPANFNYVDSVYNWRSLVDYFVINSFIVSKDWLDWNTAWWRGRNPAETKKKWRYTLWDLDACFSHYVNYTGIPDESSSADPCNVENLPNPGGQGHTTILSKLMAENSIVDQYYKTRYIDLNNTYFSCDYLIPLLDSMLNTFASEMPRQIALWGGTVAGYDAAVQKLRDSILARCTAINAGLVDCYNLEGPYNLIVDVEPIGAGEVKVNSVWAPTFPWATSYFGNIQTLLRAKANPGFTFDHWEYDLGPLNDPIESDSNSLDIQGNEKIVAVFRPDDTPGEGVQLPNAFSPNGDGHNDFFKAKVGADVAEISILIYDRWGNKVFESNDKNFVWDGNFNGQFLNTGVYAYGMTITYYDGIKQTLSGNITLIR